MVTQEFELCTLPTPNIAIEDDSHYGSIDLHLYLWTQRGLGVHQLLLEFLEFGLFESFQSCACMQFKGDAPCTEALVAPFAIQEN